MASPRLVGERFNLPLVLDRLSAPDAHSPDNPVLIRLFAEDQADRAGGELADGHLDRDLARRSKAMRLLGSGHVRSPRDYYNVAVVLQHSGLVEHHHLAHVLARLSALAGYGPSKWLAAAAMDRWLMDQGLPQHYGTQYVEDVTGFRLWDVDPATTDEERAEWNVPPLGT
ncbi:hypothetical protein [Herbidospora sp. RD11066]